MNKQGNWWGATDESFDSHMGAYADGKEAVLRDARKIVGRFNSFNIDREAICDDVRGLIERHSKEPTNA